MILVASADSDFAGVVCEQVSRELNMPCQPVPVEALEQAAVAAKVIVSDQALPMQPVPVIVVKNKPLRLRDLLKEIAGRLQQNADEPRPIGAGCELLVQQKMVKHPASGKAADITEKEAGLLACLQEAGRKGLDRDALLKAVWGMESGINTHTLETHIYRLRGKLRDISGDALSIEAVDGIYKLGWQP